MGTKTNLSWVWPLLFIMTILLAHTMLELERNKRHEVEAVNRILMDNISHMQNEIERLKTPAE